MTLPELRNRHGEKLDSAFHPGRRENALLVLGHSGCGAIKAAMKAETVPGQISSLYPYLRGAVQQSGGNISKAIDANARAQAELLRTSSTVIRDAASKGGIKVTAGIYDLGTGKVTLA